ncbi:MAG: sulfite exporter TauE/SafE family protein [Bacteroidales bacterium]|jgi:hypothetical protein
MIEMIEAYDLTAMQWLIVLLCAMLVGMAKTGLSGVGLMVVPLLASVFGGRPSVGLLLPILVFADVIAVSYYNRHAEWKYILRLLPWALIGVGAGVLIGQVISDIVFNRLLAVVVLTGIVLMILQDMRKKASVPDYWWFAMGLGLLGGFATMIGNAAGPIMALYLLSMRLPKNIYIGTGAWFFFIVNVFKVPFHVGIWKTITVQSLLFDVLMIPAIAIGALLGIWLVKFFPEKAYRIFIIATTLFSALLLF